MKICFLHILKILRFTKKMSYRTMMYDVGKCLNLLTTFFFTFCHLSQLFENALFNPNSFGGGANLPAENFFPKVCSIY